MRLAQSKKGNRTPEGVIVAHPGRQHSYEAALALQRAGLLRHYVTGFYYKPESPLGRAVRLLPNRQAAKLEGEFLRRYHPGLAAENIRVHAAFGLAFVASNRIAPLRCFSNALMFWGNRRFDRWVARGLSREKPQAVLCYDTCAVQTFERAKRLAVTSVLDQSIAHVSCGMKISREEAERHPDFADSWPFDIPCTLLDGCLREARIADCVLAASDYVRQSLVAIGVPSSRIAIVPYGVDTERFRPGSERNDKIFRVLFVGQLSQRKGIKYLLEAFKQLRLPRAELILVGNIIGSGRGLSAYREIFTQANHVPHREVHEYYQRADIFVYPSLHEGSALATYEALASGLPVIATPNCGSVVRDGVDGFIVPIRDVEALKEKILFLYENRALREEMSRRARQRAEEFTWAAYQRRVAELFRALLATAGHTDFPAEACEQRSSSPRGRGSSPKDEENRVQR